MAIMNPPFVKTIWLVIVVVAFCGPGNVWGQNGTPIPPVPSQVKQNSSTSAESKSDATRTQEQTDAARNRIESSLRMIQNAKGNLGANSTSPSKTNSSNEDRIQKLQKRLQQLKDAAEAKRGLANPPSAPKEIKNKTALDNLPLREKGMLVGNPSENRSFSDPELGPPSSGNIDSKSEKASEIELFPAEFQEPVDKYELAKSLFMSGAIAEAERQFELLKKSEPRQFAENIWAQLLLANCYRLRGRIDDAQAVYRRIVASKAQYPKDRPLPSFVRAADWYLAHSEQVKKIHLKMRKLEAEIETIEERWKDDE